MSTRLIDSHICAGAICVSETWVVASALSLWDHPEVKTTYHNCPLVTAFILWLYETSVEAQSLWLVTDFQLHKFFAMLIASISVIPDSSVHVISAAFF